MAFRICESLDTNIILRIALRDVPEQCMIILDMFMRHGHIYNVADLAITEAVYVLQQNYKRTDVIDMLSTTLSLPDINYNKNLFDKVFPMYLKHPKLSFNDCCLAGYAALNNSEPLWTFDRALSQCSDVAMMLK